MMTSNTNANRFGLVNGVPRMSTTMMIAKLNVMKQFDNGDNNFESARSGD